MRRSERALTSKARYTKSYLTYSNGQEWLVGDDCVTGLSVLHTTAKSLENQVGVKLLNHPPGCLPENWGSFHKNNPWSSRKKRYTNHNYWIAIIALCSVISKKEWSHAAPPHFSGNVAQLQD